MEPCDGGTRLGKGASLTTASCRGCDQRALRGGQFLQGERLAGPGEPCLSLARMHDYSAQYF
ncbi:MAG: hypothetical protein JWO42_514 [Chloroflexi bacterium]|nr:hypothetical protein [Chloroflexota bacterium]